MTEPPNKLDELYRMVLRNGATRDRDELLPKSLPVEQARIRYALRGNAVRLFLAQKGLCFHCGQGMSFQTHHNGWAKRQNGYSLEHLIPESKGGGGGNNIVLAHGRCNSKRGSTPLLLSAFERRDGIWAIAQTFDAVMIYRLARSMSIRGKRFDPAWLNWTGGID